MQGPKIDPGPLAWSPFLLTSYQRSQLLASQASRQFIDPFDGETAPEIAFYTEDQVRNNNVPPLHSYYNIKDAEIMNAYGEQKVVTETVVVKRRRSSKSKKRAVPPSGFIFDLPPEFFSPDFEDPAVGRRSSESIKKRRIRDRTPLGGSISRQDIEIPDILEEEDMDHGVVIDGVSAEFSAIWKKIRREAVKMQLGMNLVMSACRKMAYQCQKEFIKRQLRRLPVSLGKETSYKKLAREAVILQRRWASEQRAAAKEAARIDFLKKKKEEEEREQIRQARKLNFLLTQTELFSHFIGNKLNAVDGASIQQAKAQGEKDDGVVEESAITPAPNGPTPAPGAAPVPDLATAQAAQLKKDFMKTVDFAAVDEKMLEQAATANVKGALEEHYKNVAAFDASKQKKGQKLADSDLLAEVDLQNPTTMQTGKWYSTPSIFNGELKPYQTRGMNWLASLYETGINGILADEMGLGKTVQSVSFLCHLAEHKNVWGPFLVVSPSSTLHNWEQEFRKFAPSMRVLPYWGSPADRGIIRGYWKSNLLGTKDAEFHVMITSYQLVVSDEQYLRRMKWEYLILDEAQSIKSSASLRWKTLLTFKTRNRLLLTGTPIQNSMKELWALLHFIMPSLFDSHDEFKEWFSKDIESHVDSANPQHQHKATLNERTVQRLHMILKPFMLRRIKKDVERELPQKTELLVPCDLSGRQQHLYKLIKHRVPVHQILSAAINKIPQAQASSGRKSVVKDQAPEDKTKVELPDKTLEGQAQPTTAPTPVPQDVSFSALKTKGLKMIDDAQVENALADSILDVVVGQKRTRNVEDDDSNTLMNLVMQFRKVCNHPELFKKRDANYPLVLTSSVGAIESKGEIKATMHARPFAQLSNPIKFLLPDLVCRDSARNAAYSLYSHWDENVTSHSKLLLQTLSPFVASNMSKSDGNSLFSFLPFVDTSADELLYLMHTAGLLERWLIALQCQIGRLANNPYEEQIMGAGTRIATLYARMSSAELSDCRFIEPSSMLLITEIERLKMFKSFSDYVTMADPVNRLLSISNIKNLLVYHPIVWNSPIDLVPSRISYRRRNNQSYNCPWTRNVMMSHHYVRCEVRSHACGCGLSYLSRCPAHYRDVLLHRIFVMPMQGVTYPVDPCSCPKCCKNTSVSPIRPGLVVDKLGCGLYCTKSDIDSGVKELSSACHRNQSVPEYVTYTMSPSMGMMGQSPYRSTGCTVSPIIVPDRKRIVADSGKMMILDNLLARLKLEGHRVLLYSQMTRMMDVLEDYLNFRKLSYLRLDGSTPLAERRNMVHDYQTRPDLFVFLMSTRAGGLGINLTSADTVIFYDSDWNPTVDAQAMDRTHRVGQTKPVTVYRLITKDTIEQRILERARVKAKIQAIVIAGQESNEDNKAPAAKEMFAPIGMTPVEREESFDDDEVPDNEEEEEEPQVQEEEEEQDDE